MKTPALRRLLGEESHVSFGKALLIIVTLLYCVQEAKAETLKVVVNEGVIISELDRSELRQIFTGHRQYWQDGTKITVFVLNDNSELHKQFCHDVLQMFPYQLSRLWDQITYSGQGVTPVRLSSSKAMVEAIENTQGAIGYLPDSQIAKLRRVEVTEL